MKLLPTVGIAAAVLFLLSKLSFAGNASRLNYTISGMNLSYSGLNLVVLLNLVIQNPTNQTFNVAAIVANVTLNGQPVGNVAGFQPVNVLPTSQASVPLTVTVSDLALITTLVNIMNGTAGVSALLHLTGTVNANATNIPIDVQYQAL